MQASDPGYHAHLEKLVGELTETLPKLRDVILLQNSEVMALQFALVYLSRELEERCGIDRRALAAEALENVGSNVGEDPKRDEWIRRLLGQPDAEPSPPDLRLIRGGKA
jgi:hypothetical protein